MSTPEEKIRVLKDSIREEPDDPLGYYLLGMESAKLRRHLDAIDAFERAIRIDADYTAAYRELGKSLREPGGGTRPRTSSAKESWSRSGPTTSRP